MLKNMLDKPLPGTSLLLDRASHRGFIRVQTSPVFMNPSANRMLKILTGKNYNGIIGRAEINQLSSISEGTLLHSDSSITLIFFWTFLEMACHLVSHPCPATAVTANGFFYDSYWVMVGYKLVHAWELPRNSSHHLITFLIKLTGRLKPVKNKCVDFQKNMYLENTVRAAQSMLESTTQIETVWSPQWKMTVYTKDLTVNPWERIVMSLRCRHESKKEKRPSNGCLKEQIKKTGSEGVGKPQQKPRLRTARSQSLLATGLSNLQGVGIGTSY